VKLHFSHKGKNITVFENRLPKGIFGSEKEGVTGISKDIIMGRVVTCSPCQMFSS
jgi:hypothetical protein